MWLVKERSVALARETGQIRWLWLSVVVLMLDQVSKWLAERFLSFYEPVPVMPGFNWMLAYNKGAAFSFLATGGGWQHYLFGLLAAVVSVGLVIWMRRMAVHEKISAIGAALIIGGAIGNLIDRVLWGHVIDFIDWYIGRYHWPTFNLADAAITVGCVLMIFDAWRSESRHE